MRVFASYVRIDHNTIADDCTRLKLEECASTQELELLRELLRDGFTEKLVRKVSNFRPLAEAIIADGMRSGEPLPADAGFVLR